MATLEKIRNKSVLLFTVIIVALLAFILGDFLTSGRSLFGGGTTVAKIGDHEIDVQLYQQRLNQVNQQLQENSKEQDFDVVQAQVLNQMLFEKLMNEEWEKLGLTVTGKELADVISENPQTASIIDAIKNPGKYNIPAEYVEQLKAQLASVEAETEAQIKEFIYGYLFNGLFNTNELDAKAMYETLNTKYNVSFTSKELASLTDDNFQVTDDEIEAEWNKIKSRFAIENEVRTIDYITVLLSPSNSDNANADRIVKEAVANLSSSNGLEAIANDVNFNAKTKSYTRSDFKDLQVRNFVDTAKVGQAGIVSKLDKTYKIAKVLSAKNEMDSVNISVIQIADTAAFDSVLMALNSGKSAKSLINNNQSTNIQGADSVWIRLTDPNTDKNLKAKMLKATKGQKIVVDTTFNNNRIQAIYVINKTTPAVKISEVAEITYDVEPSEETVNKLTGELDKFLSENNSFEDFVKNAPAAGYTLNPAQIDATSSHINYMKESRAAIKWALGAEKGEISAPFINRDNTRLLVVAVNNIYNDYITPEDARVKREIVEKVRDNKKAEAIINDFNSKGAKTLADYMALTGDTITTTDVTFDNSFVNTLGANEFELLGAIAAAEKGKLMSPIKTNKTVTVFQVNDVRVEGRPYNYDECSFKFNQSFGSTRLISNLFEVLKGNDSFESKLLDFYEN